MYRTSTSIFTKDNKLTGEIKHIVESLVAEFNPERVVIFGSFARGDYREDSTVDILIISKTEERFLDRIKRALIACRGSNPPIDPLIYTSEEFDSLVEEGEGFIESVVEEGIVVYEEGKYSIDNLKLG